MIDARPDGRSDQICADLAAVQAGVGVAATVARGHLPVPVLHVLMVSGALVGRRRMHPRQPTPHHRQGFTIVVNPCLGLGIARGLGEVLRAPSRIRTYDTRFRKPLLYPLSYGG